MEPAEYRRFVGYQKHVLGRVRALLAEHRVAGFEAFPLEYEDLMRLHDDLQRLKHCPYALDHWRLVRNVSAKNCDSMLSTLSAPYFVQHSVPSLGSLRAQSQPPSIPTGYASRVKRNPQLPHEHALACPVL
jgi:hypothetical protein